MVRFSLLILTFSRKILFRNVIVRPFGFAQDKLRRRISTFVVNSSVDCVRMTRRKNLIRAIQPLNQTVLP